MISLLFRLIEGSTFRQAKNELSRVGLQNIYCVKEKGATLIGGTSRCSIDAPLKHSLFVEEVSQAIDWEQQWATFAENFYDGKAHINLSRFGSDKTLLLLPGPGFGDLSHPTTCLMLELMKGRIESRPVIDIGCGSGILTLAALYLGASSAIGIDINPEAIEHAFKNASLNHLDAVFTEILPTSVSNDNLLLMNMILPEQLQVMQQPLTHLGTQWIVSGILATQRSEYLAVAKKWGWFFREERQKDEWLGMVFDTM